MKLIIDIPEELYKGIECRNPELETEYVCYELMKAVDKGTPLDDVRAEIVKEYEDATMYSCDEELSRFASRVCGILGNIGKAESEDT